MTWCVVQDLFTVSLSSALFSYTRRQGPLRGPSSSSCGGLWPSAKGFFFGQKKSVHAVCAYFRIDTHAYIQLMQRASHKVFYCIFCPRSRPTTRAYFQLLDNNKYAVFLVFPSGKPRFQMDQILLVKEHIANIGKIEAVLFSEGFDVVFGFNFFWGGSGICKPAYCILVELGSFS